MKIFKYLKPYWKEILIVVVTLFINVLGVLLIPRITVNIIDVGVVKGDLDYIIKQGVFMLIVAFCSGLFMVISIRFSTAVAAGFAQDLREAMFNKVQNISINQFEQIGTASMIVRSTDDITQLQNLTRMGLRMALRAPLMFIGGVIMAVSTNPKLSMVFVISLPITFLLLGTFGTKLVPIMIKLREALDNINRLFRQRLTGIRVIRAFDREMFEQDEFSKANKEYTDIFKVTGKYQSIFAPGLGLIMNLTLVAVIFYGSRLLMVGQMQVGEILGFIQYANNIMMSFLILSIIFMQIPRAQASLNRIKEVLDLEEDIEDSGSLVLEDIECIEFKNVSFKYPESNNYALKDVNFYARKGDIIGIIGSTGSGKTTLANLLVRFYEVEEGQILINQRDIKEYTLKSLREQIGYAEQKANLIAGTVSSNIVMGEERHYEMDVENALEIARGGFVLERDDGICSVVEQRGRNFSGGQKQRISIARTIFKDPSLYLVDDSFSALDYKTEKELRKNLYESSDDKIMLVITQRVTVAVDSEFIVLLDKGQMIGKGTHEDLKEKSREYREILASQYYEAGEVL